MKEATETSPDTVSAVDEASGTTMSEGSEPGQISTGRSSASPPLSRQLFPTPEKGSDPRFTVNAGINKSRLLKTQQRATSASQTTQSPIKPVRASSLKQPSTSSSRFRNSRPHHVTEARSTAGWPRRNNTPDDVPPPASCQGGLTLTPKQLADLFTLFDDARREWPSIFRSAAETPTDGSIGTTAIAGNLSSDQHLPAYRDVWRVDQPYGEGVIDIESMSAVNLHSKIEALRQTSVRLMLEMNDVQDELEAVKRQRDILKERELTHADQFKILEKELEDARAKIESTKNSSDTQGELEQLRAENELFAAKIIENEVEMREICTILGFMDQENELMRRTLEAYELGAAKARADERSELSAQVDELIRGIAEMERSREGGYQPNKDAPSAVEKGMRSLAQPPMDSFQCDTVDESDEEAIEVTISGPNNLEQIAEKESVDCICCDCFPDMMANK